MEFPLVHPRSTSNDTEIDARMSLLVYRHPEQPRPAKAPVRIRFWRWAMLTGGRALDVVPAPIRPRIRHRDRQASGAP
jgi:hypothetical protein